MMLETTDSWVEIPQTLGQSIWQGTQAIAIPGLRWQAYLNQLCLQAMLPWIEERLGIAPAIAFPTTPGLGTLVNGSAITIGNTRIVLIPSEAMDQEELRVPQEWIDHPRWLGDYYLAAEVDVDTSSLRVWGYSTHHMIKTQGVYDPSDRTYSLEGSIVIQDMTVLWVMQQLSPEMTRAEVATLPALSAEQVGTLLHQLSNPAIALPRLEVSATEWHGLIAQEHWLHHLSESRVSAPQPQRDRPTEAASIQLGQWLQNIFEAGWQTLEQAFQPDAQLATSLRQSPTTPNSGLTRAKTIDLDLESIQVCLVLTVELEPDQRRRIAIQLFPAPGEPYLPTDLHLALKTPGGDVIQSVSTSSASHYLQLRSFKCASNREFYLDIKIGDRTITEAIVT